MRSHSNSLRRARPLLGTFVEIKAVGDENVLPTAVGAAFASVERVQRLMSYHDPESDVSRMNRLAARQTVIVDPMTWDVLAKAREFAQASDGAFDITVAPQLVDWEYLPSHDTSQAAGNIPVKHNGYRRIELCDGHRVRFREPALIDLGGIAKGYAVDRAVGELERHGVRNYVVNAGGDLRVGATPEPIHVRHPIALKKLISATLLRDAAIATSAAAMTGKVIADRRVQPIVEPSTGAPAVLGTSVSVVAADCVTADALTKVVALLRQRARPILACFNAEAVVVTRRGAYLLNSRRPSTTHSSLGGESRAQGLS